MNFFRSLLENSISFVTSANNPLRFGTKMAGTPSRHSKRFKTNDGKKELELENAQIFRAPPRVGRKGKNTKKYKIKAQSSDNKTSKNATFKRNYKGSKTDLQPDRGTVNLGLRRLKRRITEEVSIDSARRKLFLKLKKFNDKKDMKAAQYRELIDEIRKLFKL